MRNKRRLSRKHHYTTISEINITPFVDVLLIILIVFMVTAPMMNLGFDVSLPKSEKNIIANKQPKQVTLVIDKEGSVYYNKKIIPINRLSKEFNNFNLEKTQFFIQADKDVKYQNVISLMSALNQQGFKSISLITELKN